MNEANKVISPIKDKLGIMLAEAVSRYGDKVEFYDGREKMKIIKDRIKDQIAKGYINIAIIGRDSKTCEKIYKDLIEEFENVNLISEESTDYEGGITIVPSYYSKGLEFDSVIIADRNDYSESDLDRKLLYVAMTRAMHSLLIIL